MWRNPLLKFALSLALIVGTILLLQVAAQGTAHGVVLAQDAPAETATVTPPTQAPISVNHSEPSQFTNGGQDGILSVFGANFTAQTTIRLIGVGLLQVTFVNSGALTAVLPADLPAGLYGVEVSDPGGGTVTSPNPLSVVAPPPLPPTATPPTPPTPVPTAFPTLAPPTPVPGQPSLIVRDFVAIPSLVAPGGPIGLTFVVLNQGNRAAQGVSVALDSSGKFFPANGQAGVALPDMPPGSSVQVTLNAVAARDAAEGPTNIPLAMSYRDFEGNVYSVKADLSVEIAPLNEVAQVSLVGYAIDPQIPEPGALVTVHVSVSNTGNETASRALLRINGDTNVLLAGRQGDSFPLSDIEPGGTVSVDLPMVINPGAEAGPQSQSVTISYLQDGDAKETTTSMTIEIAQVVKPAPLILLESYGIGDGRDSLSPGDRFTLSMTLHNVGQATAAGTLVTFGTVDAPPASSGGNGSSGDTSGGSGASSSSAFAPLGAGDTLYVGELAAGGSIPLQQDFIVNSTVDSGIYSLPITVRYQKADGDTEQQSLRASVIVIAPLRVQTSLASPLPETTNVGDPLPVTLKISNNGSDPFNVTSADVTVDNAEIMDGAHTLLSPIKPDKDGSVNATIMPSADGEYTVTFTVTYTDDLNREQTMVMSYSGQAETPPTPDAPMETPPAPAEAQEEENLLGRLLLGFLGLGG